MICNVLKNKIYLRPSNIDCLETRLLAHVLHIFLNI